MAPRNMLNNCSLLNESQTTKAPYEANCCCLNCCLNHQANVICCSSRNWAEIVQPSYYSQSWVRPLCNYGSGKVQRIAWMPLSNLSAMTARLLRPIWNDHLIWGVNYTDVSNPEIFTEQLSPWALKISPRPSVIPREARNLNLPLKSEMSRFRFAPLDMTYRFYCALTV